MKVILYNDCIRHFDSELEFERFVGLGCSPENSNRFDSGLDSKLLIGIGLLLIIGAAGFYYYNMKKQREKAISEQL